MKTARRRYLVIAVLCVAAVFISMQVSPSYASDATDSRHVAEKARMTLENFDKAPEMDAFRSLLKDAKGVFIVPQMLKGAFVVGAAGGTGALVIRDGKTGYWVGPAFYTIGEGSFGLQAGAESSEVILLVMTERGVTALLGNSVKLGADVGIAVGPVGAGAAASTANLSADIVSFARSKGLFAGIALDGAVIKVRRSLNEAYYGRKKIGPMDILIRKTVRSSQSEGLLRDVAAAAAAGKKEQ